MRDSFSLDPALYTSVPENFGFIVIIIHWDNKYLEFLDGILITFSFSLIYAILTSLIYAIIILFALSTFVELSQ